MRINDAFAATVAAVVPVLWLVAVVEVHQYQRRLFPQEWPIDEQLATAYEVVRSISGAAPPEVITRAARVLERAELHVPENKPVLDRFVRRYELVSVGLMCLEAVALLWLLGWRADPVVMGWICLVGTGLGFYGVLRLPIAAINQQALFSTEQRARRMREIREFLARQSTQNGDGR
jgi:hypothetical protein